MSVEDALVFVTINPAKALEIYPAKGCVQKQADADVLLFDENLNLDTVIARGKVMMKDGIVIQKGTFNSNHPMI